MATITNERKIELLTQFNENAELKEAVKEILLEGVYGNGVIKQNDGEKHNPMKNWAIHIANAAIMDPAITPAMVGAKVMGCAEGINFIEQGFKHIEENYKPKIESEGDNKNPAR